MHAFKSQSASLFARSHQQNDKKYNLSLTALHKLKQVKIEKKFMVVATNKSLGPVILETPLYIKRALDDHLLNTTNYKELSEVKALTMNERTYRLTLLHWVDDPTMDPDSRQRCCPTKRRPLVPIFLHHPKSTQSTLETPPGCELSLLHPGDIERLARRSIAKSDIPLSSLFKRQLELFGPCQKLTSLLLG
jgi:hypothetical protein